jgi:hypothetical protein
MAGKIATCYEGCPFYLNWEGLLDLCELFVGEKAAKEFDYPLANPDGICLRGVTEEAMEKYLKVGLEEKVSGIDSKV